MTHLCAAIFVTDPAKARANIAQAAEAGADMVELRIDHLTDAAAIEDVLRNTVVPCILTCRPTWEGGYSELGDGQRLALLTMAAQDGKAAYIDLELKSRASETFARAMDASDRSARPGLIVSYHDFSGRPKRLYNIMSELSSRGADVIKIVWLARTIRDNLEAFEILQHKQKPTIALCMGEAGLISRVLAKKFGAFLTFAALDESGGTASGQIPVSDMKRLYRWDAIGPGTKVYGVVGSPVMHSMSPAIHNAAFNAISFDGVYLPLLVEAGYESFKAFMETFLNFEGLDLSGLSITIPHKENALRYLREKGAEIEPLATSIGTCNTIVVDRQAGAIRLRGMNTDYAAILDSITAALGIAREDLSGRSAAVIGAGGTGRTAVAALARYGATVTIYNRTRERAEALAREFDGHKGKVSAASLDELAQCRCEILINATSVGMHPHVDQSPLDGRSPPLSARSVAFDTVYNPMRTKLLRQAQEAGARTIGGVEMFLRQAVGQFQEWTGQPAPLAVMRQVIEDRLAK